MLRERSLSYIERMHFHRRFYLPAILWIFIVLPGSVAALLPSGTVALSPGQRIETLLLFIPTAIVFALLLVWSLPRQTKIVFGFLALAVPHILTILVLRTTVFTENFYHAAFRLDVFFHFLPAYLMFVLLCFIEQKKRAKLVVWSLIILAVPMSIYSAINKNGVKFIDELRFADVHDRLALREPMNEYLLEQCNLISESGLRLKCTIALSNSYIESMPCDATEGVSDCTLSRGEHVRKLLSGHPDPRLASPPNEPDPRLASPPNEPDPRLASPPNAPVVSIP